MLLTTLFSLRALFTEMLGGGYNYVRVLLKFLLYFRTNDMVFATSFSNSSAKSSCNKKGTIYCNLIGGLHHFVNESSFGGNTFIV